jgi:hypothetical protein
MIGFINTSVTLYLLITINTALSLIYRTPLHTRWDFPASLVVCWQRISTQKLSLRINVMSSCYFVFNLSVLLCANPHSINLHDSLRTRCILVLEILTAETSWTLLS